MIGVIMMGYRRNNAGMRANKQTDMLGFGEVGGVGQLVYHSFRFADYEIDYLKDGTWAAIPVCDTHHPPDVTQKDYISGGYILSTLCNLAKKINDLPKEKPFTDLILDWCKDVMHPYHIDEVYGELTDEQFDLGDMTAELAVRDATFSLHTFMEELGKLYDTARFYTALMRICEGDSDETYDMYDEEKRFPGLPYLERYKHSMSTPKNIDVSAAKGDLLKEMQIECAYMEAHPAEQTKEGDYAAEPFDDYERLRDLLMESVPDFRLRLKLSPKTGRMTFAVDVDSVFEIAWLTLAHMMSEDPLEEHHGGSHEGLTGVMMTCRHCGDFFIRRNNRQEYCDKDKCQKARNAKNQREFRKRKRMEKVGKT